MLILVVSWLLCINAVDNQHLAVNAVNEAVQQSVRFAANHQYALDWSDLEFDKSFGEWIDKWTAPAESHRIVTPTLPSDMTFSEAINAGVMHEKEIIRHFATKSYNDQLLQERSYQEIMIYILRNLENNQISDQTRIENLEIFMAGVKGVEKISVSLNYINLIFEYGRLDLLKYFVENRTFDQFKDFKNLPVQLAAQNGHSRMIEWILEKNHAILNYKNSISGSIRNDKKRTFANILETAAKERPIRRMDIFAFALATCFLGNRADYAGFVLKKVSEITEPNSLSQWSEGFLKMYSKPNWNPTVENLDYFFSQQVWNPRSVRSIVLIMSKAADAVLERIGMELLNPRLHFLDSIGYDPLQRAIDIVNPMYEGLFGKAKKILQKIKMSEQLSDHGSAPKRLKLGDEVEIFGMPFHPVDSDAVDIL